MRLLIFIKAVFCRKARSRGDSNERFLTCVFEVRALDDWPRLPGATRSRFSAASPIDRDTSLSDYRDGAGEDGGLGAYVFVCVLQ